MTGMSDFAFHLSVAVAFGVAAIVLTIRLNRRAA